MAETTAGIASRSAQESSEKLQSEKKVSTKKSNKTVSGGKKDAASAASNSVATATGAPASAGAKSPQQQSTEPGKKQQRRSAAGDGKPPQVIVSKVNQEAEGKTAGEEKKEKAVPASETKSRQELQLPKSTNQKDQEGREKKTAQHSVAKAETASSQPKDKKQNAPGPRPYGVVSPPSFMLSELVQEDEMFSTFEYVALTECENRVYGYGTLSADTTSPMGDEGMVDFDPSTNRFHLIYCAEFASDRRPSVDSNASAPGADTQSSPGCRQRATLAARRVKSTSASSARPSEPLASGAADSAEEKIENNPSSDIVWRLLLFGGFDELTGTFSNNLWEFCLPRRPLSSTSFPLLSLPSVGCWREVVVTGTKPPPRADHAVCMSHSAMRMYLFGGVGQSDDLLDDCYVLTEENKWVKLAVGGTSPAPRRCHTLVCGVAVGDNSILYLFGGDTTSKGRAATNDLWKFNVRQKTWMCITSAAGTPPSPRYNHASVFANNRVWVGGGIQPGWFGPCEMKDLFGFDVTALFWFQCEISLGKVQQLLPRFRPLAYIPATKSFFIFGCSQDRHFQQTQAAVCTLTPVCTMESFAPLHGMLANVRKDMEELVENTTEAQELLRPIEQKLPLLKQQISQLEEKQKQLQQKLKAIQEKRTRLCTLTTKSNENSIGKVLDKLEKKCPSLVTMEKTIADINKALQQTYTVLKTKAAANDVAYLAKALNQLSG